MKMKLIAFLEKRGRLFWAITGFILVMLMGIIDYATGVEYSVTLFYLIPIFLVSWFADEPLALGVSALSAVTWFLTDYANGLVYSNHIIYVWNTLIRLGFFIIATRLLSALKKALAENQGLARVDYVSGAVSVRYFYELAQAEINRFKRYKHAFTLIYIDLDNFKAVNDSLGHITGDRVLRTVTGNIQGQIRPTDVLARMGGDEFALLFPETGEQEARQTINRIHSNLLKEMLSKGWVVTFSIGVVTFTSVPKSVDEMIRLADGMMYSIKNNGKNGVGYQVY
jgi:diguanylate cyclase (GGDEF)-like protein